MGIFSNIKAKGNISIDGVSINTGKSVFEQIKKHIFEGTRNKNNEVIRQFNLSNRLYYLDIGEFVEKDSVIMKCGKDEYFETEEEMINWLNQNGWEI